MKSRVLFLALIFLASSCKPSPATKYEQDGISFTCPAGWRITSEKNMYGLGHYLSIEKDGWSSSGILTMTWHDGESDLDMYLSDYSSELKNSLLYKKSNLTFGDHYESTYNGLSSLASDFTVTTLGLKHQGVIHVINKNGRTIVINIQEAIEDESINQEGLKKLESSFVVLEQI